MTGPRRTYDREITDTGWEHIFRIELKSRAQTEVVMNYVRDLTESELRRLTDHELGAIAPALKLRNT